MSNGRYPTAEYEITPEDWGDVNAAHLFDSPLYKQLTGKSRIAGTLVFVLLSILSFMLGSSFGGFMFGLSALVFPILAGPLQRRAQRSSLRKMSQQGIANGVFGPHRVEVRPDGLFHATSAYETLFRWHAIEEVKEKAGHFFVYMGPHSFLPIPVTAFPDSQTLRDFAERFYERLEAGRRGERLGTGEPEGD